MIRKINAEVLAAIVVLVSLAVLLCAALITGGIHTYVHPRVDLWLWLSIPALLLISASFLPKLFRPVRNPNVSAYVVLLIPILTATFLPAVYHTNAQIQFGGTDIGASVDTSYSSSSDATENLVSTDSSQTDPAAPTTAPTVAPTAAIIAGSGITLSDNMVISDAQFVTWLVSVNDDMNAYEGVTVTYKGQVYRDDDFSDTEFVPVRLAMWCCAADTIPYGFLCEYDNASDWADDTWVLVTGVMHIEDRDGEVMPVIYVTSVEEATPPADIYVYIY